MEMRGKLRIMQTVLESGGHFSGINRKVRRARGEEGRHLLHLV
jgi:hypothetical protein